MEDVLEIEVDSSSPPNGCLRYRPLQRNIRGRLDWSRIGEPEAHRIANQYGGVPIPGQVIGYDPDRCLGYVREPLHDAEHAALKQKIEKRGNRLAPIRENYPDADEATWVYWMKSAVEAGYARVVKGELPKSIEGEPRKDFVFAKPQPTTTDKLTASIQEQTAAFRELTSAILKLVTVKK